MTKSVNLQHRHFVLIAEIIASTSNVFNRSELAHVFADKLADTNPRFDRSRFLACAMGTPGNGRDA